MGSYKKPASVILGKDVSRRSLSSHFPSFDKIWEKTETKRVVSYGTEPIITTLNHSTDEDKDDIHVGGGG